MFILGYLHGKGGVMKGFSLIELMIVVAIMAFLAMIAVPNLMSYLSRAYRTEAYVNLRSLLLAEKAYAAEHGGKFTKNLQGADSINWKPQGQAKYTYGFPGAEGTTAVIGSLKTPVAALNGASIDGQKMVAYAAGDIDGDGIPDVLSIDQDGTITIVHDDLA